MIDVSSVPPWTPMPSSSAGDEPRCWSPELAPAWSGGTPGWVRNVISPWRSRSSRLATPTSALLPPWPLRNTSRRAGVIATHRPRSSSTASMVSADSHIVPGAQACSLDLV